MVTALSAVTPLHQLYCYYIDRRCIGCHVINNKNCNATTNNKINLRIKLFHIELYTVVVIELHIPLTRQPVNKVRVFHKHDIENILQLVDRTKHAQDDRHEDNATRIPGL